MDLSEFARLNPTDHVREILVHARVLAARTKDTFVRTDHILLAVFHCGGVAAEILRRRKIDADACLAVLSTLSLTEVPADHRLSVSTAVLLDVAIEERQELGLPYSGSEHLLLAMTRVEDCIANQVLMRLGLAHEAVRTDVQKVLGYIPA